jgi:predicted dienelactone hydrolase
VRLLEIVFTFLLIVLSTQFFLPEVVGRIKKEILIGLIIVVSIVIFLFHLVLEGLRWQMIPIYLPAIVVFIWGIFQLIRVYNPKTDLSSLLEEKTHRKKLAITNIVVIIVLVASSALIDSQFPMFHLPAPTGKYEVGTTTFQLIDSNRNEIYTDNPEDYRKIMARAWYPAEKGSDVNPAPYIDSPIEFGIGVERSYGFPAFVVSHLSLIHTNSYRNIALSPEQSNYPILIFSHGYGGPNFQNTVLLEELASHGFVIFSLSHPYESMVTVFPDGTIIYESEAVMYTNMTNSLNVWTEDTLFLIDQLEKVNNEKIPNIFWNRLDLERIGVLGHSFGGTTAEEVCLVDPRVKVGVSLDSPHLGNSQENNLTKPFMLIFGKDYGNSDMNDTVYLNSQNSSYGLFVEGARHYNFADVSIWTPILKILGRLGSIDGYRMLVIMNNYVLAFFNKYLHGIDSSLLNGPSTEFPEVLFYSRNV